jgi:hypothetical protein
MVKKNSNTAIIIAIIVIVVLVAIGIYYYSGNDVKTGPPTAPQPTTKPATSQPSGPSNPCITQCKQNCMTCCDARKTECEKLAMDAKIACSNKVRNTLIAALRKCVGDPEASCKPVDKDGEFDINDCYYRGWIDQEDCVNKAKEDAKIAMEKCRAIIAEFDCDRFGLLRCKNRCLDQPDCPASQ